ncbi:MAG: serine O-acetyltransferase, partial [Anaeroplasma bactoclasticum]|nr:serine O-acetyltransferase [Anaeroplasma bactoclasticum]
PQSFIAHLMLLLERYNLIDIAHPIYKVNVVTEVEQIMHILSTDLEAYNQNDPAIDSKEEVIYSYPGFYAIMAHRLAHWLDGLTITYLPRYLSEYAHSQTGIDIHPKAMIGSAFFIDHGTGIVIGETTQIGERVRIYQGVTLGAKSLSKGNLLKGSKRHPTIASDVIIYAGATILGGETHIGKGSIIGAHVLLDESVDDDSIVIQNSNHIIISKRSKTNN